MSVHKEHRIPFDLCSRCLGHKEQHLGVSTIHWSKWLPLTVFNSKIEIAQRDLQNPLDASGDKIVWNSNYSCSWHLTIIYSYLWIFKIRLILPEKVNWEIFIFCWKITWVTNDPEKVMKCSSLWWWLRMGCFVQGFYLPFPSESALGNVFSQCSVSLCCCLLCCSWGHRSPTLLCQGIQFRETSSEPV